MKFKLKILSIFCIVVSFHLAYAQQVNSIYFMDNNPVRHNLNPAFQPQTDIYIGLPILGYTSIALGNNSLTLKDLIYNKNGQTITFLHPSGSVDNFYNVLQASTLLEADFQSNLLSFGFRNNNNYFSLSITEKFSSGVGFPKDIFKLLLYGTPNMFSNSYDFKNLQADLSLYSEIGFGFSRQINEKLTVGTKLKLLLGTANISNDNDFFNLQAGNLDWTMKGNTRINFSSPLSVAIGSQFQSISISQPSNLTDWLKPSGVGAGIDAGIDYKFNDRINFSAAIIDLGFINWTNNTHNLN